MIDCFKEIEEFLRVSGLPKSANELSNERKSSQGLHQSPNLEIFDSKFKSLLPSTGPTLKVAGSGEVEEDVRRNQAAGLSPEPTEHSRIHRKAFPENLPEETARVSQAFGVRGSGQWRLGRGAFQQKGSPLQQEGGR